MQYLMPPMNKLLLAESDAIRKKRLKSIKRRAYRKAHPEKRHISEYKKRGLGFTFINDFFKGGSAHHIDTEHIICIPMSVHRSIPHNVRKPETMKEINRIAFEYLTNTIRQI